MINMQALEQALSGIEELGHAELEFLAGDTAITLRMLTPDEEMEVQRYARMATAEVSDKASSDEKELSMMLFLDRFKQQVLAFSIIQVDMLDLREIPSVATGEMAGDKPVHIPRHEAVRKLVEKWKRPLLMAAFAKYGQLTERVEKSAADKIVYTPTERTAEIERLEKQLHELKRAQAEEAHPSEGNRVARQVEAMVGLDKAQRAHGVSMADSVPKHLSDLPSPDDGPDEELPVVVTSAPSRSDHQASVSGRPGVSEPTVPIPPPPKPQAAPSGRRSSIPTSATQAAPSERAEATPEPDQEPPTAFDGMMDSMSESFDEDAIAVENARLMAVRKHQAQQQAAERAAAERAGAIRAEALQNSRDAMSAREAAPVHRAARKKTPPHRAAANTADAALDAGVASLQPARSRHRGTVGGKDTYEMPPTTLSARGAAPPTGSLPPVDQPSPDGGSANPRFKGRRKG